MSRFQINTGALMALNPEYAEAVARGEPWALKHQEQCRSLNAGEPKEMRRKFDGKPRKWCGAACSSPEGCVVCTLPENPEIARENRRYRFESEARLLSPSNRRSTMKVLMQHWYVPGKGALVSISKNKDQLNAAVQQVKTDGGRKDGKPLEVEIPDDHAFVDMLKDGTVFLHNDEMDVIIYSE